MKGSDIRPCDQCDFAASQLGNLKQHKKVKHERIRYPCDQCEYAATQLSVLKKHKESKHKRVRYPCATQKPDLKTHKKYKHEGTDIPVISVNILLFIYHI